MITGSILIQLKIFLGLPYVVFCKESRDARLGFQLFVDKKFVINLLSNEEELWFLSSSIICGLARMAIVAAIQHQENENNDNVGLKKLNLRWLVGSEDNESEGEDEDNLEWELNVVSDEDSDGEGDNSDWKNEVLIKTQCGEKKIWVL
jgi:hypothetical protein